LSGEWWQKVSRIWPRIVSVVNWIQVILNDSFLGEETFTCVQLLDYLWFNFCCMHRKKWDEQWILSCMLCVCFFSSLTIWLISYRKYCHNITFLPKLEKKIIVIVWIIWLIIWLVLLKRKQTKGWLGLADEIIVRNQADRNLNLYCRGVTFNVWWLLFLVPICKVL
jgi:hypothetical protein